MTMQAGLRCRKPVVCVLLCVLLEQMLQLPLYRRDATLMFFFANLDLILRSNSNYQM